MTATVAAETTASVSSFLGTLVSDMVANVTGDLLEGHFARWRNGETNYDIQHALRTALKERVGTSWKCANGDE